MVPHRDGGQANHGHACVKPPPGVTSLTHACASDDPCAHHRSVARGELGKRRLPTQRANSAGSRPRTAAVRSAASPRRAARTGRPSSCRSSCARASATTTSIPAHGSAMHRPATALARHLVARPARRPSTGRARRCWSCCSAPTRARLIGVRITAEAPAAAGRATIRRRPSRPSPCTPRASGPPFTSNCVRARTFALLNALAHVVVSEGLTRLSHLAPTRTSAGSPSSPRHATHRKRRRNYRRAASACGRRHG